MKKRRREILEWLQQGPKPGQRGEPEVEEVAIPAPTASDPAKKIAAKKVTWTRNDGETLVVMDRGEVERAQDVPRDPNNPNEVISGPPAEEPIYEVIGGGPKKEALDSRSPETKADQEEEDKQKRANAKRPDDPHWETDADREKRKRQETIDEETRETRRRQVAADDERNRLEAERIKNEQARTDIASSAETRAGDTASRQAANEAERIKIEQAKADLEREKANRPEVISKPTDADEQIATYDPTTGKVTAQDNPLYNAIKVAAQQKKEELALAIQARTMSLQEATQQYTKWYAENVELPFKQAAERRAQATEIRQAQDARDRREQFKVTSETERSRVAQVAGQNAAQNELAQLPYRAGPLFGEQISSAINSLGRGGTGQVNASGGVNFPNNASSGINFTADAFEFARPDVKAISRKATAAALKGISRYIPPEEDAGSMPSYEGLDLTPNFQQAPTAVGGPNIDQLWQGLYGNIPYTPPVPAGNP